MPSSASSDRRRPIPWIRDDLIDYGDVELELCTPPALYVQETVGQHFIVGKDRDMVEDELAEVGTRRVERMVDVGVYKGGSVVLYHKVFAPEKLVAIELSTTPLPSLDAYAARQSDRSVVIARGVNQADAAALDRICVDEFAGQPLDLVVDDASHLYAETRATFQALFPRLRTGALYIIEDWSWAHWPGDFWQKERGGPYFRDKEPLTNLLIELALLCGSSPEIVSRVHIRPMVAFVERDPASVAPNFEPSQHYFSRGAPAPRFDPRRSADQLIFASSTFSFRQ